MYNDCVRARGTKQKLWPRETLICWEIWSIILPMYSGALCCFLILSQILTWVKHILNVAEVQRRRWDNLRATYKSRTDLRTDGLTNSPSNRMILIEVIRRDMGDTMARWITVKLYGEISINVIPGDVLYSQSNEMMHLLVLNRRPYIINSENAICICNMTVSFCRVS